MCGQPCVRTISGYRRNRNGYVCVCFNVNSWHGARTFYFKTTKLLYYYYYYTILTTLLG